jgi:hypothetical protein
MGAKFSPTEKIKLVTDEGPIMVVIGYDDRANDLEWCRFIIQIRVIAYVTNQFQKWYLRNLSKNSHRKKVYLG